MKKPTLNLSNFAGLIAVANATTKSADAQVDISLIDIQRQVRTELGDLQN